MKIIFNKAELTQALVPAMGSVSSKNTMNSTEGILIETEGNEKCVISAYDLEKGIRLSLSARVIEGGSYIIKADKLNQIVRALPGDEITLEVDKRNVTKISSGRSSYELHAMKGEDFPNLPELTVEGGLCMKKGDLRMMVTSTIHAVAQNDVRVALNGEYFDIQGNKITIVACDANRLAVMKKVCEIEGANEETKYQFILPGKSLTELIKLIGGDDEEKVYIHPTRKHVIFKVGEIFFFSRLIEEQYIDYDRFIPKDNRIEVKVSADELMHALERALLVTEEKSMGQAKTKLKCSFSGDVLMLSSISLSGSFADEVKIEKDGEDIDIGFNCRYLLEAVKACTVDEIKLNMSTPLMSMIIRPDCEAQEDFTFLVLPVKMKD